MSHYKLEKKDYSNIDTNIRIAIITAEFNKKYTSQLQKLNKDFLIENGFNNISIYEVPGAFEIPGLAQQLIKKDKVDLIICLGVVIQGDTPHFDYVCGESARGIMDISIQSNIPIMNGILTCLSEKQVIERLKPVYALSGLNTLVAYNQ